MNMDLNADVGEGLDDAPLIPLLTSVNIACGGHAGNDETIDRAVALAVESGAHVGAHPSYPDPANFGRLAMKMETGALEDSLARQIERVWSAARNRRVKLHHVKPHGALYHSASQSEEVARAIVAATLRVDPTLILVGAPGAVLLSVGRALGLTVIAEAFADRRYLPDGQLAPRSRADALIADPESAAAQALQIVRDHKVTTTDGTQIPIEAQTLCLHGDTPGAPAIARCVRERLVRGGVKIAPVDSQLLH
jgi:5-oxoprolinase (ATP-hydrolysing) subunit A